MNHMNNNLPAFFSIAGTVVHIANQEPDGCTQLLEIETEEQGIIYLILTPDTYLLRQESISEGMYITGFFDANAPVPLIYPPRYRAVAIVTESVSENVTMDRFDRELVSSDHSLQLNLSEDTSITLTNGQQFTGTLENRPLLVVYTTSTRSIPAQTTPQHIVVLCPN